MADDDVRSEGCGSAPMDQFATVCKPMLDAHAKRVEDIGAQIKTLVDSDATRTLHVTNLTEIVTTMSKDFRRIFYDSNGDSLVSQVKNIGRGLKSVDAKVTAHCAQHAEAKKSVQSVLVRVVSAVAIAIILGLAGYTTIGLQHHLESTLKSEMQSAISEMRQEEKTVERLTGINAKPAASGVTVDADSQS